MGDRSLLQTVSQPCPADDDANLSWMDGLFYLFIVWVLILFQSCQQMYLLDYATNSNQVPETLPVCSPCSNLQAASFGNCEIIQKVN